MLLGFALIMVTESTDRLINPIAISFDQALVVAVAGLIVNGASAWILIRTPHEHGHSHGHDHQHDHNLRAAYLHVLADALTSLLAIVALLAGKYLDANWLDPAMGIVGAVLVAPGPSGAAGGQCGAAVRGRGRQKQKRKRKPAGGAGCGGKVTVCMYIR